MAPERSPGGPNEIKDLRAAQISTLQISANFYLAEMSDIKDLWPKKFGNWIFPKADPPPTSFSRPSLDAFRALGSSPRPTPAVHRRHRIKIERSDQSATEILECPENISLKQNIGEIRNHSGMMRDPLPSRGGRRRRVRLSRCSAQPSGPTHAYDKGHYHMLSTHPAPLSEGAGKPLPAFTPAISWSVTRA